MVKDVVKKSDFDLHKEMYEINSKVSEAKARGEDWLEVDPELLVELNGGKEPGCGYVIYKDVRLAKRGEIEAICKRENLSIEAINFGGKR